VSEARRWLETRVAAAPPRLLSLMLESVPAEPGLSVPEALAEGALKLYGDVVRGPGGRDDALALLAADALFTHAFQAQSELDHAGLTAFAVQWGPRGRLAEIAG
jgi:hypothetical protein